MSFCVCLTSVVSNVIHVCCIPAVGTGTRNGADCSPFSFPARRPNFVWGGRVVTFVWVCGDQTLCDGWSDCRRLPTEPFSQTLLTARVERKRMDSFLTCNVHTHEARLVCSLSFFKSWCHVGFVLTVQTGQKEA